MKNCDLTKIKSKLSLTSLLLTAGLFSKTAQAAALDCTSPERTVTILQYSSFSDLVKCAVPDAARTVAISPYGILVLVINFIAIIAVALSVLGIVLGLLWIATSAGNKTKYEEATKTLKNSVIALIVTILAERILKLLLTQFGFPL